MKRNKGPTIFGSPPEGWGEQPLKPFSFLLPPGNRSSFRVVPDTPTNTPKSLADSPGVTMVLETPEALMGESRVVDNPSGGPEDDVGHTSSALGVVKLRRRNMMSFLESDFSHKEDVSSELSDNDAAGSSATPKQQWLWSRVVPALGTPQSSRRRKSTMANIIVPSDLNDEDFLATKLSHIQQEEKSARARRRSSACSTPRHHGPANSTPEATKRDPQLAPTNTRARPSRTSGLGTSRRSEVMDRETRGRTTTTTTTTSAENCNATILFNDEDLQLTPVHCRGQPKIGPDRHTTTTTPNTTPSRPGTSEDTEVTEDTLRRLQTRKSPLLQLRKFSTVATQKMVEELKNTPQRTRRGEGLAERLGGAECHPLVLHSTPQRKDRAGSTDSSGSGGGASLPSPAKDPSCVLKGSVPPSQGPWAAHPVYAMGGGVQGVTQPGSGDQLSKYLHGNLLVGHPYP
ncbi:hypothetical protein E2C01_030359 [Portunus trituberculatus]|uniref:Uncharacterized protein n=1 Tax=Portunus trituberculatus TaxID=210409 RepID=A0A5B7EQ82_PORTR|nr:hypothetical protein [Portunus trituberculatus]